LPSLEETVRLQLQKMMKESSLMQKDVAKKIGIKAPYLSQLLAGKRTLYFIHVTGIAKALGYEVNLSLKGEKDE
jgi:transcriptional regulator with XRE-family HTH domain